MSSIRIGNQVEINKLIKKSKSDSFVVSMLDLFLLRDKEFDNIRSKNLYLVQYWLSIGIQLILIISLITSIYWIVEGQMTINLTFPVYWVTTFLISHLLLRRSKVALEYYNPEFSITNNYFLKRGITEYGGKMAIEIVYLLIIITILVANEKNGNYDYNFSLILIIIGTSLKTAYAGGMMAGVKNSSILKNYRYSAILDSIFFHGTLVTAAGFLSIIISPFFDPKPLEFSQVYFIVILVLFRVYIKTRRHLLMEPIKNGVFNKAYKELVIFSDEDRMINEFVDDYTKFKRKITDNGKLSISGDKIENAWLESKLKSNTPYQPIFMVLVVNSTTLLITEIAKDYGYKQVVQPWLKTILQNPNYIINILVFIVSILLLIYMSKMKK